MLGETISGTMTFFVGNEPAFTQSGNHILGTLVEYRVYDSKTGNLVPASDPRRLTALITPAQYVKAVAPHLKPAKDRIDEETGEIIPSKSAHILARFTGFIISEGMFDENGDEVPPMVQVKLIGNVPSREDVLAVEGE